MNPARSFTAAAASAVLSLAGLCTAAGGAAASTGAGTGAWPLCLSTPAQPGHSYQLTSGGWAGAGGPPGTTGIEVTDTGDTSETLTLSVQPGPAGQALSKLGRPVPAAWVTFGHRSVPLSPGQDGWSTVIVTIPAAAPAGTYVADLAATAAGPAGTGTAAAAATDMAFTVGITQPPWPTRVLHQFDPCWALPGHREPWQQWSGITARPPGWSWGSPDPGTGERDTWYYTPPPGWTWSWADPSDPRQVYAGGPARPCVPASAVTANGWASGGPGGGPWIGGQYPDTSTAAGCAAWLKASTRGTLASLAAAWPAGHPAAAALAAAHARTPAPGRGLILLLVLAAAAIVVILASSSGQRPPAGMRR